MVENEHASDDNDNDEGGAGPSTFDASPLNDDDKKGENCQLVKLYTLPMIHERPQQEESAIATSSIETEEGKYKMALSEDKDEAFNEINFPEFCAEERRLYMIGGSVNGLVMRAH